MDTTIFDLEIHANVRIVESSYDDCHQLLWRREVGASCQEGVTELYIFVKVLWREMGKIEVSKAKIDRLLVSNLLELESSRSTRPSSVPELTEPSASR